MRALCVTMLLLALAPLALGSETEETHFTDSISGSSDTSSDSGDKSSGQISKPSGTSEFNSYDSSSEGSAPVSFGSSRGWSFGSSSATGAGLSATVLGDGGDGAKPSSVAYGNFFGMVGGGYAAYKAFELEECIRKKPPPPHCARLLPGLQSKEEAYAMQAAQQKLISQQTKVKVQEQLERALEAGNPEEQMKAATKNLEEFARIVHKKTGAFAALANGKLLEEEMGMEEESPSVAVQARPDEMETKKPPAPVTAEPPRPKKDILRG